ncbi:MAG: DUF5337 domain-containing protein [Paracoccaceae bacterium]
MTQELEQALARKGRITGTVIAGAGLLAILAPWLVQVLGLPFRYEFLFYFFSLAAFVWAIVNIYHIWRARREHQR